MAARLCGHARTGAGHRKLSPVRQLAQRIRPAVLPKAIGARFIPLPAFPCLHLLGPPGLAPSALAFDVVDGARRRELAASDARAKESGQGNGRAELKNAMASTVHGNSTPTR